MKHPLQAVIFDMDGLILDSERVAVNCLKQAAREYDAEIAEEHCLALIGLKAEDSYRVLRERLGELFPLRETWDRFCVLYERRISALPIPCKAGLLELLDLLDKHEIKRAVATSTAHKRALHKLELANVARRFNAIVGGDQAVRGKPAPDIFLGAAAAISVSPSGCVALEDSENGARAAMSAGMRLIIVPDLVEPPEEVKALAAFTVSSLHDARREIEKMLT